MSSETHPGDVASSAHHPIDIDSQFRKLLAALAANQYAILPMAVVALVGSGALYQLDASNVPNDEIWELHSVHVLVTDPGVSGTRTMDVQLRQGGNTLGTTGTGTLINSTNTLASVYASGVGFTNMSSVADSLTVWQGQTVNKQMRATMPYTQFMYAGAVNIAITFSVTTVTVISAVAVMRRRRRMQPLEIYA